LDKKEERNPKQKPPSKQLGGFKIPMNHEAKAVLSDTSETLGLCKTIKKKSDLQTK
jgi:hypothetical protein